MKNKIILVLLLLIPVTFGFAQITRSIEVSESQFEKKYRLTGFIKTSDTGVVRFWAYQKDSQGKFLKDKSKKSKIFSVENDWKKIVLTGRIKSNSNTLTFGIWATIKIERYNIDNIKLEFSDNGNFEEFDLKNGDFESMLDTIDIVPGWKTGKSYFPEADLVRKVSGVQSIVFTQTDLLKYGNYDEHGHKAKINGVEIYYEIYGQGEPILLLHGNNESMGSFRYQIDELKKNYQVIAVDSRGQGKSTIDDQKMTYELMSRDMDRLLEHLNIDSVNIIGWSDGGNTGLLMARNYPERVKTLTIMGANLYLKKGVVEKKALRQYRWGMRYMSVLSLFNPKTWNTKFRVGKMPLKYPNIKPTDLEKIKAPVLVMSGENDIILENHTKLISDHIDGSKLVILKDLSHYAPQENPEYFNNEVVKFLENNKPYKR